MARLASFVHVQDEDKASHIFGPDDVLPDWAVTKITNPKAWAIPPERETAPVEVEKPAAKPRGRRPAAKAETSA